MNASLERDSQIFGEQPDTVKLSPEIDELSKKFGIRVERLTQRVLSPTERAIIDKNLLALELNTMRAEGEHRKRIHNILEGYHNPEKYMQQEKLAA
ncbi:hypothetical protein M0P65_06310 [Candidatus Gracilibacteria bacterium]|nr:hypothetical protein [Candidatus Gracilibacteria bacterium]